MRTPRRSHDYGVSDIPEPTHQVAHRSGTFPNTGASHVPALRERFGRASLYPAFPGPDSLPFRST